MTIPRFLFAALQRYIMTLTIQCRFTCTSVISCHFSIGL